MSSHTDLIDTYLDGFRHGDHAAILNCLTDDVVWHVHGVRTTHGRADFDTEIENPAFGGRPERTVDRTVETDEVVVVTGQGIGRHRRAGEFRFAYSDLFTFRGELIAQVDSYIVTLR